MTRRCLNWEAVVVDFAQREVGRPFEWGETDCASLARRVLRLMYGAEDPFLKTPAYSTQAGALRAFRRAGSIVDWLLDSGAEEVGREFLWMGDLAIRPEIDVFVTDGAIAAVAVFVRPDAWLTSRPSSGVVLVRGDPRADSRFFRVPVGG